MTGAAIVRWREGEALVLSVHGSFDGASAWALRIEMDEGGAREVVVDLTHAEEACDFAACVLAAYARERRRDRRIRFRSTERAHARLLRAHGLDVELPRGEGVGEEAFDPTPAGRGGGLGPAVAAGPTVS